MKMLTAADDAFYDGMDVSLGPGVLNDLAATVARGLDRIGDGVLPRLSHVTQEQIDSDWCSLTFHVHLTTDLILPVELYGPPREISATQVVESVRSIWSRLDFIAARSEIARRALERCLYDLGADRIDMHLRAVALAPVESWTDADTPSLALEIDILGDDLKPKRQKLHFNTVEACHDHYRQLIHCQTRRMEIKRFLVERGATGSMDQLTMAAINALPDPEQVLCQLARHERIWPTNELYIGWREGRALSSGNDFNGLSWNGSHLEFAGVCLPPTALVSAVGRPITVLSDHPLLSSAMIVAHAWQAPPDNGASEEVLVVEIECVDHLFSGPHASIDARPLAFRDDQHLNGSRLIDGVDSSRP